MKTHYKVLRSVTTSDIPAPLFSTRHEAAMTEFRGKPAIISTLRGGADPFAYGFEVRDWASDEVFATHYWPYGFVTTILHEGVRYLFGASRWDARNGLYVSTLSDDGNFIPSTPVKLFDIDITNMLFNTSVWRTRNDEDGNPQFRMAMESVQGGISFKQSSNLYAWSDFGGCVSSPNSNSNAFYMACPQGMYNVVDDFDYLTSLRRQGLPTDDAGTKLYTSIGRSKTFANPAALKWCVGQPASTGTYNSSQPTPDADAVFPGVPQVAMDGLNFSDQDWIEIDGNVYGIGLVGGQYGSVPMVQCKVFFSGTIPELVGSFEYES